MRTIHGLRHSRSKRFADLHVDGDFVSQLRGAKVDYSQIEVGYAWKHFNELLAVCGTVCYPLRGNGGRE